MAYGWPRYEPVTFSRSMNVSPTDLDTLNQARLPREFLGGGTTLDEPLGVNVPGRGYLIHFAQGHHEGFYYNPATGEVLWIHDWPGPQPRLVNSTLVQFTQTVKVIIDAFPFSEGVAPQAWDDDEAVDKDIEQRNATAAMLRERIREIDPVAMAESHSFWEDFTSDVEIGDYATIDVVGESNPH